MLGGGEEGVWADVEGQGSGDDGVGRGARLACGGVEDDEGGAVGGEGEGLT